MLAALVIFIYILFTLWAYGRGFLALLGRKRTQPIEISVPFVLLLGLMVVTTLGSFASIFIRLNWEFQTGLFLGTVILVIVGIVHHSSFPRLSMKNFSLLQKISLALFCISALTILYASTLTPANADTGIYHAQTIHWIESYPVVPGLVNLQPRLGYDSSWLLANAIFSLSFLNIQSFHLLTGVFFFIMAAYFYSGVHELLAKKYQLSNFLKLGFFLSIFVFLFDQVSSPGTDAPATLLVWFLLTQTVQLLESRQPADDPEYAFVVFLTFFCITIKVSSAPLLLLALGIVILLIAAKKYREIGWMALGGVILLLPFITRNLILTGYPVFPGFPVDLFNFDWKLPLEKVREESQEIHLFATLSNMPQSEFDRLSWRDQTIQWYANLLPRQKAILLFIVVSFALNGLLCAFKGWRSFIAHYFGFWSVYLTAIFGCVFWFISAPAFRFGYGFLLAAVFLLGGTFLLFILEKSALLKKFTGYLVVVVCVVVIGVSLKPQIKLNKVASTLLLPADYPSWSSQPCSFANFKLLCQVDYDSCWYSPFPCAISGNDQVEMRGEDYREGFRHIQ